jgi:hypothetical protein
LSGLDHLEIAAADVGTLGKLLLRQIGQISETIDVLAKFDTGGFTHLLTMQRTTRTESEAYYALRLTSEVSQSNKGCAIRTKAATGRRQAEYLAARKKLDRLVDMKTPALPLLALGCLCVFVAGCNRAPSTAAAPPTANATATNGGVNVTVSGQVFIVTKSGESIKLGLVRVGIDDSDGAELQRKSICDMMTKNLSESKAKIDDARASYQAARNMYDKLLPDYADAKKVLEQAESEQGVIAIGDNEVDGVNSTQAANIVKLNKQLAVIGAKLAPVHDDMMNKFQNYRVIAGEQQGDVQASLETYFSTFGGVADTKTDADGKFTLSVPAGKTYVLAAESSRSVGDSTEKYYWIVDVDLTKANDGLTVLLSNDNEVDDPISALKVDSSLVEPDVVDLPVEMYGDDYVKVPASYTFKSPTGDLVVPDSPSTDSTSTAVATSDPSPAAPVWTPPSPLPAKDNWTWTLQDKTYQNVVITSVDADTSIVEILYTDGNAHIPVTNLPADIQKLLNYPPAAPQASTNTPSTNAPSSVNQ